MTNLMCCLPFPLSLSLRHPPQPRALSNANCKKTRDNIINHAGYSGGPDIKCYVSGWERIYLSPSPAEKKPTRDYSLPINQSSYPLPRRFYLLVCHFFCTANGCPG